MAEEKDNLLSSQLSRPTGLISSGCSTPRSTPRATPSRSKSPSIPRKYSKNVHFSSFLKMIELFFLGHIGGYRDREVTPSATSLRRLKVTAPKFYAVPHNRVAEEGETIRFQVRKLTFISIYFLNTFFGLFKFSCIYIFLVCSRRTSISMVNLG